MSGTCKDCRHWRSFEEWWEEDGRRTYESLEDVDRHGPESLRRRYGTCMMAESDGETPDVPETKAFAVDGENYTASLETAPDFGCVQFSGRSASGASPGGKR